MPFPLIKVQQVKEKKGRVVVRRPKKRLQGETRAKKSLMLGDHQNLQSRKEEAAPLSEKEARENSMSSALYRQAEKKKASVKEK